MKTRLKTLMATLVAATSAPTFAHPGHDHNSWMSDMMHALFYGSIAAIVVLAAGLYANRKVNKTNNEEG